MTERLIVTPYDGNDSFREDLLEWVESVSHRLMREYGWDDPFYREFREKAAEAGFKIQRKGVLNDSGDIKFT